MPIKPKNSPFSPTNSLYKIVKNTYLSYNIVRGEIIEEEIQKAALEEANKTVPRVLKIILITLAVVIILYGIYSIFGRPAISLPTIRYPVPAGQPLHDIISAADSGEVLITLNTKGSLELNSADDSLTRVDYTPETFLNTLQLGLKLMPGQLGQNYQAFVDKIPLYPGLVSYVVNFFYRILPLRISVNLTPQ